MSRVSRSLITLLLGIACQTRCGTCFAQSIEHVIHISVDGLHAAELRSLMDSRPEDFANFQRFRDEGVITFNARNDVTNTFTLPNHTTMLTGRPVDAPGDDMTLHHGYRSNSTPATTATLHNSGNAGAEYVASVFDQAHDRGLTTSLFAGKAKFSIYQQSYMQTDDVVGGRPDQYLQNGDQGSDKIDSYVATDGSTSTLLMDTFVPSMKENLFEYTFLHLLEPDEFGHAFGWRSPEWIESVQLVDNHLGRVFQLVDMNEDLRDRTAIILTADHGGAGFFHEPDQQTLDTKTIPFFVWGPNIAPGDLYERNQFTRVNPLDTTPDYLATDQPIRNGDSSNLALALLGLPPVEGSSINARQDLLVELPGAANWHGDDATSGNIGDGVRWRDPNNWTRNGVVDRAVLVADNVIFQAGSRTNQIDLQGQQFVESLDFRSDYSLSNGSLHINRGAIHVEEGVQATFLQINARSDRTLLKTGAGTLEVHGNISDLFVVDGELTGNAVVNGDLHNGGLLAPGNGIGTIQVDGFLDHRTTAVLEMEISKDAEGVHQDHLAADELFLRGGLSVVPIDGYASPTAAGSFDRFELFRGNRIVTIFNRLTYDGQPGQFQFAGDVGGRTQLRQHAGDGLFRIMEYDTTNLAVVNYRAHPGDVDGDGAFDSRDLVAIFQAGKFEDGNNDNADWLTGDWTGDHDFGTDDLVAAFQTGLYDQGSVLINPRVVPEPAAVRLFAVGIVVLFRNRRSSPDACRS